MHRAIARVTTFEANTAVNAGRCHRRRRRRRNRSGGGGQHHDGAGKGQPRGVGCAAQDRTTQDAIAELQKMSAGSWNIGEYRSKRKEHLTNDLGDIVGEDEAAENISEQPGWDSAGKLRFCVMSVADELGMDEEEVGKKFVQLFTLIPGLDARMGDMKIADLVRLVANVPDVALALVRLRDIMPEANLGKMIASRPSLLLEDADNIKSQLGELREACPRLRWDAILTDFPQLFGIRDKQGSIEALKEKLGLDDDKIQDVLSQRPLMLLSVQSRHDMISYDNGTLAQVQATIAGDRFSDGW